MLTFTDLFTVNKLHALCCMHSTLASGNQYKCPLAVRDVKCAKFNVFATRFHVCKFVQVLIAYIIYQMSKVATLSHNCKLVRKQTIQLGFVWGYDQRFFYRYTYKIQAYHYLQFQGFVQSSCYLGNKSLIIMCLYIYFSCYKDIIVADCSLKCNRL